jgi:hypothetical protein
MESGRRFSKNPEKFSQEKKQVFKMSTCGRKYS